MLSGTLRVCWIFGDSERLCRSTDRSLLFRLDGSMAIVTPPCLAGEVR
jgi:hypothetical protein